MSGMHDETTKSRERSPGATVNEKDALPSREDEERPQEEGNRDPDFHPIRIPGEPLSAMIIRERRERPW